MTRIKFTRDQLLELYKPDYPIPNDMNRSNYIFIEQPIAPKLFSNDIVQYHRESKHGKKLKKEVPRVKKDIAAPSPSVQAPVKSIPKQSQPVSTPLAWFYIDPKEKIQGPFQGPQMRGWWEQKFLPPNLKISTSGAEGSFKEVKEYFPNIELAFSYNPALFPFYGKDNFDENHPLHVIFQQYKNSILSH